jgi:hypothetical protein
MHASVNLTSSTTSSNTVQFNEVHFNFIHFTSPNNTLQTIATMIDSMFLYKSKGITNILAVQYKHLTKQYQYRIPIINHKYNKLISIIT